MKTSIAFLGIFILGGPLLTRGFAQIPGYQWTNFAGLPGGVGNADGTGSVARFFDPGGICYDAAGNVLLADTSNHAIRQITSAGAVTTFAGLTQNSGTVTNATGTSARFWNPRGVVMDSQGNFFVADQSNSLIRKITPAGFVTNFAGSTQSIGTTDGTGAAARFNNPQGLCIDTTDNLYVADTANQLVRKITPAGVVTTIAGTGTAGSADGTGTAASFNNPMGIAVNSTAGILYVSDNTTHIIRQITLSTGAVVTLAGSAGSSGSADGTGSAARFNSPRGLCLDAGGNVLLCDRTNATIRKITPAGAVTTVAGTTGQKAGTDGTGSAARFWDPDSICVDGGGTFTISDLSNRTIRRMTSSYVVTTLAGLARNSGSTNGTGGTARFSTPNGIAFDGSGNLYVADNGNHLIRKVTSAGVVSTFAGQTTAGFTNATGTAAQFRNPDNIAIDGSGTLYVADNNNHAIRMITSAGVVTTLAGSGSAGSADGTGAAATFRNPQGVALDGLGNLWVADTGNHSIRKIVIATGVVTTAAGLSGTSGTTDATGTTARFNNPSDLVFNTSGNLFIADRANNSIRMMTPSLVVTTFAGISGGSGSADGQGTSARLNQPYRIGIDGSGYFYVGDASNHLIRKISPSGNVITIGGVPLFGSSQDGTGTSAWFSYPRDMTVASTGEVYLVENGNNRISKGVPQPPVLSTGLATGIGPSSATLNGTLNPNGTVTGAVFEYGTTTSYGSTAGISLSATDNLTTQNVSAAISGLAPNTTYHFRLSATNGAAGTATSTDGTFTTPSPAPDIQVESPVGTILVDGGGSLDFGTGAAGSGGSSRTFTIRNTGQQTLTLQTVTADGANAGEFSINSSGMSTSLAAGATTAFTVSFAPLATGPRTAALHIASNVSGTKNPYDISLAGAGSLPAGWTSADIGGPVPAGSTAYDSTTQQFTVSGGGSLLATSPGAPDKFQYAWQSATGNFIATVRIESVSADPNSGAAPRAGLMLRATSDPLSPYALVGARRDGTSGGTQTSFESWRVYSGDQPIQTSNYSVAVAPYWVRITRWNDKIRLQISWDGTNWASDQGMIIDNLPQTVCIGLATASRDSAAATAAVFSGFSVQPLNLTHESSWIGNSIGGSYYGPHVMNAVHSLAIDSVNGVMVMGGDEETREMHIYDLNGHFRYVGRNTSPNGGQTKNVVVDGTNVFTVGPNGVERWRYDGFRTHVNSLSTPTPNLVGITLVGSSLYVVDATNQQVRVFAKADLTENASAAFTLANAQRITADSSGFLWIAQASSGATHKVLRFSTAGVAQGQQITLFSDSVVSGVTVHPSTGEIWVADRGPRQQFHIFKPDGSYSRSIGAQGGIYSTAFGTIPGQPHPMKFNSPTDVQFDSSGNMYVACMGASDQWTQGSGTEVRKFDTSNNQLWELLGLTYVDNADPVPGTDGTEVYTQTRRMTIDYSKPTGQQWTYAGYTFDPFTYPGDARATQAQPASATVRIIGGQKILYVSSMDANWVAMYRFQAGSEIAMPCGLIKRETDRGKPDNTFYIWVDANGNGATDAGEVDASLTARSQIWGFTIDTNGGLWAADKTGYMIRYYPCKGLNSIGAPAYGANYPGTSEQDWPVPSDFTGGSTSAVYPLRAFYVAERDELYVGGYRVGREEQGWSWKTVGSCLGQYSGWLGGTQARRWLIDLPYEPAIAYNGDLGHSLATVACLSVAGDYIFAVYQPTLDVFVYNRWTGAFVQTLDAGPEVCGNQALLDIVNGLSAIRRSNGEYVMWMEDDGAQKVNMYRWHPTESPAIQLEQPAGAGLTSGSSVVSFGSAGIGQTVTKTFSVSDTGGTSLFGLSLSNDGAADFVVNALSSNTVAPGETLTFNVAFTPSASGSRAGALHVLSNDSAHPSFDISLAGNGLSAADTWRQTYFGTTANSGSAADTAKPDGDGIANLLKYALIITPGNSGTSRLPAAQTRVYAEGRRLALFLSRDPARNDITTEVQTTDSPAGTWTTVASSVNGAAFSGAGYVGETDAAGGLKTVEVRDTLNMSDAPRRFMRIRVTR